MAKPLTDEQRQERLGQIKHETGLVTLCCTSRHCGSERLSSWKVSEAQRRSHGRAMYYFRCLDCKKTFTDVSVRRMPGGVMYIDVNDKIEVRDLKVGKITSEEAIKNLENMKKEE